MKKLLFILFSLIGFLSGEAGIYIIGDFNNWTLPEISDSNGAVLLDHSYKENMTPIKEAEMYLPEGSQKLTLVWLDDETYAVKHFASAVCPNFQVTDISGINDRPELLTCDDPTHHHTFYEYFDLTISKQYQYENDLSKIAPFHIQNWEGGKMKIGTAEWYSLMRFHSDVAPAFTPKSNNKTLYIITQIDDLEPQIIEVPHLLIKQYREDFGGMGHKVRVLISSEKSLSPSPENTWGMRENRIIRCEGVSKNPIRINEELVQGGYPFEIEFSEFGWVTFYTDWKGNEVTLQLNERPRTTEPEHYWAEVHTDGKLWEEELTMNPATGFLYPLTIEGEEISVLVKSQSLSPDSKINTYGQSFCQQDALFTQELWPEFSYDKVAVNGALPYSVRFHDRGAMTIELSPIYGIAYLHYDGELTQSAGIDEIIDNPNDSLPSVDSSPETTQFFDLMGNRVENPGKGIYLEKRGDTVKKVLRH